MTKLLIVDDSTEMRQLLKSIVRKSCNEVFECEDGDEVLAAFTAHQPDWVVMDIEMKRMDGLKATASLVRLHPQARVIILTQHADVQTRIAAREAGARFFVGKGDLLNVCQLIQGE
jgi:CheY-like chemotaxis protein